MSKTIKLENKVYAQLTALMRPKESYSQVVERILAMFDKMGELRDVLEGAVAFRTAQGQGSRGDPIDNAMRAHADLRAATTPKTNETSPD